MKLYFHPLSTYSQKVLLALYEKGIEFTPEIVDLFDEAARAAYQKIYPMGKVPLLIRDDEHMIPESSIIIEYLDGAFNSGTRLIPDDRDQARQVRFIDRMHDLYLNNQVAESLFESWKPEAERNHELLEKYSQVVHRVYEYMNRGLAENEFCAGEFSMADCATAPPLFYAQQVLPFSDYPHIVRYFERLQQRPSFTRVLSEARPYLEKLQAQNMA